ncbi:MAG: hypothetical protein AB1801_17110, partial [Chloroflexota bacterium]
MHAKDKNRFLTIRRILGFGLALMLLFAAIAASRQIAQAKNLSAAAEQLSPIHPIFAFLDENGVNVLESGGAVSTMQTCGACHDAEFIEGHSFHASIGLNDFTTAGQTGSGRAWDTSLGFFGKWNPIAYRYLSPAGDEWIDLTTPMWMQA